MTQHRIGGITTEFATVPNTDPDIEENTGVSFPGQQLDMFLDKTYKEGEKSGFQISSYFDLIVLE